jgi:hypothetical protein
MQAQKEAPSDMQCKDKFLLQSVVAPDGTTTKVITSELVGWLLCFFYHLFLFKDWGLCFLDVELRMEYFVLQFNKEGDKVVEEFKLRVVYIPANPPSPVPEESDEGSSPPRPSVLENGNQDSSLLDAVSISFFFPVLRSSFLFLLLVYANVLICVQEAMISLICLWLFSRYPELWRNLKRNLLR